VAFRESLFWDGRSASLEEQALLPIVHEDEMGHPTLGAALDAVAAVDAYRPLFAAAFGDETVTSERNADAQAAFQRTMISSWAPYDRYVAGDAGALDEESVEGMFAFGELGCADCHTPPLFERERYAARVSTEDPGRGAVTAKTEDVGAFRVPTLRNVRETGPFFHDGRTATLDEAVRIEVENQGGDAAAVRAIATFLRKGLTDRSQEPDRPESVPSGLEVPPDGFRIPR
ncbi:MAG: cytochrome c peroxidase, partial [Myxococcota bacterium]